MPKRQCHRINLSSRRKPHGWPYHLGAVHPETFLTTTMELAFENRLLICRYATANLAWLIPQGLNLNSTGLLRAIL